MKHKVKELNGALLDAAVALAEGRRDLTVDPGRPGHGGSDYRMFEPSRRWEDGGPILEREGINPFSYTHDGERYWAAKMEGRYPNGTHGTKLLLVAAMRAYVASKFGEEVDLPDDAGRTSA